MRYHNPCDWNYFGVHLYGSFRRRSGKAAPVTWEFSKICKRYLRKLQTLYFIRFLNEIKKPSTKFSRVWRLNAIYFDIFEIFDLSSSENGIVCRCEEFLPLNSAFGKIIFNNNVSDVWGWNRHCRSLFTIRSLLFT